MSATYSVVAAQGAALRMIERRRLEVAVAAADRAGADDVDQLAVQRGDDDAVVVAVGDEQPLALFVGQNFAGKAERRRLRFGRLQVELEAAVSSSSLLSR